MYYSQKLGGICVTEKNDNHLTRAIVQNSLHVMKNSPRND